MIEADRHVLVKAHFEVQNLGCFEEQLLKLMDIYEFAQDHIETF